MCGLGLKIKKRTQMSDIYESSDDTSVILPEEENPLRNEIHTSPAIKIALCGVVTELKKNHATTKLYTTEEMAADSQGLIHTGFIISAANYAALAAINEENAITINSRINLFAPAKLGDVIDFEASAYFDESRKREVRVVGHIKDIKVFEGTFALVMLEEHVFLAQQKNIQKEGVLRRKKEREKENAKAEGR